MGALSRVGMAAPFVSGRDPSTCSDGSAGSANVIGRGRPNRSSDGARSVAGARLGDRRPWHRSAGR